MTVLLFGFDGRPTNEHHPRNIPRDTVVYPAMHDTDTAVGWWEHADDETRERAALEELGVSAVVGAVLGDVDRDVPEDADAALTGVPAQRIPLALEPHLIRDVA